MFREYVFTLDHIYEYGEDLEHEETKSLGIYSTEEKAIEARARYYKLPGFNRYPLECFMIGKCYIDEDAAWTSGFVNSNIISEEFETLTICFNRWLGITKSPEDSLQDLLYYNTLCQVNEKIRNTTSSSALAGHIKQIWEKNYLSERKSADEYRSIAKELKRIFEL